MESFTPIAPTLGGVLIGLAAAGLLVFHGRIAGISGIAGGIFRREPGDLFSAAMIVGVGTYPLLVKARDARPSTEPGAPATIDG